MRENPSRDERGFTLPEVLVAMAMMGTVLFALYAVFDASVRVFGAGRDRVEAVQNARLGLARMERELRAAYPPDKAGGDTVLLESFGEEHVTFHNDLNANRRTVDPATGLAEEKERITYRASGSGVPLRSTTQPTRLVESAGDIDGDGKALTFEYLDSNGDPVVSGGEADVAVVKIRLEISVGRADPREPVERSLRTSVALRNR